MLQVFHQTRGGQPTTVNGQPFIADYGDVAAEYIALTQTAGLLDLSSRSRLCLIGADRARFLHGQVTNDVKKLRPGQGCYAAVTTAKGKLESDLNIYSLAEELLLDFEPGLTAKLTARLEKYLVADDVQIVDAAPHYGLLSLQGPRADAVLTATGLFASLPALPAAPTEIVHLPHPELGDIYLANQPRLGTTGYDLFIPCPALPQVAEILAAALPTHGGRPAGWTAFEAARIAAGIPRYGADMDENYLPLECGLEQRAIVYTKGCYIGQEVINRIHSFGRVTRELRRLRLPDLLPNLPAPGEKIQFNGKDIGHLTSVTRIPGQETILALGYLRQEALQTAGAELTLHLPSGDTPIHIAP